MTLGRRAFLGGLVAAGAGLVLAGAPGGPPEAEALTALRAKISWDSDLPRSLADRQSGDGSAYVFWRDPIITRQSNPDRSREQVLTSTPAFVDTVTLTSSLDIQRAVLRVDQPTFGASKNVHVRVAVPSFGLGPGTQLNLDPQFPGDPAIPAGLPIEVLVYSRIPVESQLQRPTPRVFTSIVRVLERPDSSPATRNLNKALIVRTELQAASWATNNGRPTPTPIGQP
jgi:hypothetical protein